MLKGMEEDDVDGNIGIISLVSPLHVIIHMSLHVHSQVMFSPCVWMCMMTLPGTRVHVGSPHV